MKYNPLLPALALTLSLLAPPARAQAPFGNAISFNGTTQYVAVANFGNIIPTNEITVEFWANTSVTTGQSAFILNPDDSNNRFNVHINYGPPPAQGVTYWDFGSIGGNGRLGNITAPVNSISNWVHYAFVASKSGSFMSIYTNGMLMATKTTMTPFTRGAYDLHIGGSSNYFAYNGSLDEFRVWKTALSQAQIQANLGVRLTGNETNLVLYYRFDSTNGVVATNSATATGSAFNGTLVNAPAWITSGVLSSVVTNIADSGPGTLRAAISNAPSGTTITFGTNLSGSTILLTNEIVVSNNVTIDATSLSGGLTLSGGNVTRIFFVASGSSLALRDLTLAGGNGAGADLNGQGGAIDNAGTLTLLQCTLSSNSATFYGGALANRALCGLTNCTLASNSAQDGGAIINDGGGTVILAQCTLTLNHATGTYENLDGGGAIDNYDSSLSLFACVLAGNTSATTNGPDLWMESVSLTAANCLIGDGTSSTLINGVNGNQVGTGGSPINALLAPLGNYGGTTQTMPPYAGSPAIDAGSDAITSVLATDQRGFPRLSGAHVDIGAAEVNVNSIVTTNSNGGSGSLRNAIASVAPGDLISFASSLSGQTITLTGGALALNQSVTIDGSELANGVVIDGDQAGSVFYVSGGTVVLSALTITNGLGFNGGYGGGGIYNTANLTVNRCTLVGNSTAGTGNGGGILNMFGTVAVNESTLTANLATGNGGGAIFSDAGNLTVNQSTLTGNHSTDSGGGIYTISGSATIYNSIVAGNSALAAGQQVYTAGTFTTTGTNFIGASPMLAPLGYYGGRTPTMPPYAGSPAIDAGSDTATNLFTTDQRGFPRLSGAHVDIGAVEANANSIVTTNGDGSNGSLRNAIASVAPGELISFAPSLSGQTITLTGGELELNQNVTIDGSALTNGIQINGNGASRVFAMGANSTATLTALTITNGSSSGSSPNYGGGVINYFGDSTLTLNRCTIAGNSSPFEGGGLYNIGTMIVNECTFSGNVAGGNGGGGIYNDGVMTLLQSTISGNSSSAATTGNGFASYFGTLAMTNTLVAGNSGPSGLDFTCVSPLTESADLTNGNPMLAPLGNYGGPTLTMPPYAGSPAIDAGIDTATNLFATDQRGYSRLSGAHVDIGAVEVNANSIVTTNGDGGNGSLRNAIASVAPADLISFAPSLSGQTIALTNGELVLTQNVTIDGSALKGGIAIDGNDSNRVIYVQSGMTVLNSLTITNGYATGNDPYHPGFGGGIFNDGTLIANNCTVVGGLADDECGGIQNNAIATLNQCTITGNNSPDVGGGVRNEDSLAVNQCTIVNNSGGGIFNTIGGGGFNATVTVDNSIIAGNFGDSDVDNLNAVVFTGSNIVQSLSGAASGPAPINVAPDLAPLGNYGGPTPTMPPLPGSPAIDGGNDAASLFATDQRGYPRQTGAHVDIGAVEVQIASLPPALRNTRVAGGALQFGFTNLIGGSFSVFASTNLALPLNQWSNLGTAVEAPPGSGDFQFTDPQATKSPRRFYRVRSP